MTVEAKLTEVRVSFVYRNEPLDNLKPQQYNLLERIHSFWESITFVPTSQDFHSDR